MFGHDSGASLRKHVTHRVINIQFGDHPVEFTINSTLDDTASYIIHGRMHSANDEVARSVYSPYECRVHLPFFSPPRRRRKKQCIAELGTLKMRDMKMWH